MTGTDLIKVAVIVTSTRSPRVGPKIGDWVKSVIDGHQSDTATYEVVDLADYKLPVFDEPIMPAMVPKMGQYTYEHTKKWTSKIASYGGYIFITPEYNYGIPGSTKNAIDYLYHEIQFKPAVITSYGIQGGKIANEALKTTLEGMKLRVAETRIHLPFHGGFGPDAYAAGQGALGEDTKNDWEKEQKPEVLKALGQLEKLLKEPVPEQVKN